MTTTRHQNRDRMIDAGYVRDDRGRRVTQIDPVKLRLLRRHDVIEADALKVIADEVGPGVSGRSRATFRVLLIGGVICSFVFIASIVERALTRGLGNAIDPGLMTFLPLWVFALLLWRGTRRRRLVRARRIMLRHRRCPSCGYHLEGLPSEPADGLTVCPECGAAWRPRPPDPGSDISLTPSQDG